MELGQKKGEGLPSRLAPTEVLAKEGYLQPEQEEGGERESSPRDACRLIIGVKGRLEGLTECLIGGIMQDRAKHSCNYEL